MCSSDLKYSRGKNTLNSFYKATIALIPKADKDTTKKRKLQANIFDEYRCKNPQQNISKPNPAIHKKVHIHDQVGFILGSQGQFNIRKSISVIHHNNKRKDKNHMIISIDAEKAFDKIQHPFVIKLSSKWVQREHILT